MTAGKHKGGRPPVGKAEKRSEEIIPRYADVKRRLQDEAKAAGVDLATYCREKVLTGRPPRRVPPEVLGAIAELARQGNNLNQLADRNSKALPSRTPVGRTVDFYEEVVKWIKDISHDRKDSSRKKSFKGAVEYDEQTRRAASFVGRREYVDTREAIRSFNFQRKARPEKAEVVGHISLSFHADDAPKLTDDLMRQLAGEYMQRMNITDTQYIVVRHGDTGHPHLHIIYNRVKYDAKLVRKHNERIRNVAVCKAMKQKYALTFSEGQKNVDVEKLHGPSIRSVMRFTERSDVLPCIQSVEALAEELERQGIATRSYTGAAIRERRCRTDFYPRRHHVQSLAGRPEVQLCQPDQNRRTEQGRSGAKTKGRGTTPAENPAAKGSRRTPQAGKKRSLRKRWKESL